MNRVVYIARRAVMPVCVLAAVMMMHFVWRGFFPEQDPAQSRWVAADPRQVSWFTRYIEERDYWLGASYGLSLAFAAVAFRRYREGRLCVARNLAVGGVTFCGVLSVVGCYLLGCCGSPMLAVYLSLFGAAFVPLAKPLVAGVTLLWILLGWWWMNRHAPSARLSGNCPPTAACDCAPRCKPVVPDVRTD
ncbi:hypothetical protein [Fontivita pretiosa]|uniref:hypothetical protein n=1 Tax=Fontivita pretiosa TaxID=2989684 RepID=UPI003D1801BF